MVVRELGCRCPMRGVRCWCVGRNGRPHRARSRGTCRAAGRTHTSAATHCGVTAATMSRRRSAPLCEGWAVPAVTGATHRGLICAHHRSREQQGLDLGDERSETIGSIQCPRGESTFGHGSGEQHLHRLMCPFEGDVLTDQQIHRDCFDPRSPTRRASRLRREHGSGDAALRAAALQSDMIRCHEDRARDVEHLTSRHPDDQGVVQAGAAPVAHVRRMNHGHVWGASGERGTGCAGLLARRTRLTIAGHGPSGLASSTFLGTTHPTIPTITRRRLGRVLRVLLQAGVELSNPRHQLHDPCRLRFDQRVVLFALGLDHPLQINDNRFQLRTPGPQHHPTHRANNRRLHARSARITQPAEQLQKSTSGWHFRGCAPLRQLKLVNDPG